MCKYADCWVVFTSKEDQILLAQINRDKNSFPALVFLGSPWLEMIQNLVNVTTVWQWWVPFLEPPLLLRWAWDRPTEAGSSHSGKTPALIQGPLFPLQSL